MFVNIQVSGDREHACLLTSTFVGTENMGSADMKVNDSVSLLLKPVPLILFSLGHTSLLALKDFLLLLIEAFFILFCSKITLFSHIDTVFL